ncbi:MAG: hypothetical protein RLP44_04335 [Aggregatilineales bacterium]
MFDNLDLSPREQIAAAVLGFMGLLGLINGEPGLALLMGIIVAVYLYRQNEENKPEINNRNENIRDEDYIHRREMAQRERPANVDEIRQHALDAVRRAGLDPAVVRVLPVDLGVISFRGDDKPVIHRTQPVDDDCDYVQPYVQLRVPVDANGRIKFEIYDEVGQKIFAHEDRYDLQRGRNLIMPSSRLPVHDEQNMDGRWRIAISADGMPLATYEFRWQETEDVEFRRHVLQDGEISNELQALLEDSQPGQLSLDDLLAAQDDEANQQRL